MLLAWSLVLMALALYAGRTQRRTAWLAALALWVVVGFWSAEVQPAPASQAAVEHYADGLRRVVRGRILRIRELPQQGEANGGEDGSGAAQPVISLDLAVDAMEEITPDTSRLVPVNGGVRLTLTGEGVAPPLRCGDQVEATLRLRTPERYRDPGAWQYADYLAAQGIGAGATLPASQVTVVPGETGRWHLRCALFATQRWAAGRLSSFAASRPNQLLPGVLRLAADDAGMLNAMLFGDRDHLSHALRLGFERTGSFHLFVVSGMHVALLAGALFYMARRLRLPMWAATVVTIFITTLYALLTGFGAPVQRALWMSSIFLIARLLHRDRGVMNSLGAAALGVLVLSPSALFEASFQMTFLVIVAIAGIAIPLGEWSFLPYLRASRELDHLWLDLAMHPRLAQFRISLRIWGEHLAPLLGRRALGAPAAFVRCSLWLLELLLISVVAEMVMVLPMAAYFHRATIFALPANVLSIPLVAILAPMGVVTFLASLIGPWIAAVPAAATALLLHGITDVIGRISRLHAADWRTPGPSTWVFALAVVGWLALCWLVRRSRNGAVLACAFLPVIAAIVLWPEPAVTVPHELEVTAMDVGQGDSLLVVSPDGGTMLIDAEVPPAVGRMPR